MSCSQPRLGRLKNDIKNCRIIQLSAGALKGPVRDAFKRGEFDNCQRALKRSQFDKEVIRDIHGKCLVTLLRDASIANRLVIAKTWGTMSLFASGMLE